MTERDKSGPRAVISRAPTPWQLLLSTVYKWGPGAVAIVTLVMVLLTNADLRERVAYLEGGVNSRANVEIAMRAEIQTWQAYVNVLRLRMAEAGVKDIPPPPPMAADTEEK